MKISNMIHAVDLHACGEPGRVIVGGVLDVPGESMFEKMQSLEKKHGFSEAGKNDFFYKGPNNDWKKTLD